MYWRWAALQFVLAQPGSRRFGFPPDLMSGDWIIPTDKDKKRASKVAGKGKRKGAGGAKGGKLLVLAQILSHPFHA
mgnify:CR=1 FL=1